MSGKRLLAGIAVLCPAAVSLVLPAAVSLLFLAAGCSDDDAPRSLVRVVSVNDNRPLQSDVLTVNTDRSTSIMEDSIILAISNTPSGSALQPKPDGPFGFVTLERYVVRFESTPPVPDVNGALGWIVHTGETIEGELVVVPAVHKTLPPLVGLVSGGEIVSRATIRIYGREATSNMAIKFEATLPVHFANWRE